VSVIESKGFVVVCGEGGFENGGSSSAGASLHHWVETGCFEGAAFGAFFAEARDFGTLAHVVFGEVVLAAETSDATPNGVAHHFEFGVMWEGILDGEAIGGKVFQELGVEAVAEDGFRIGSGMLDEEAEDFDLVRNAMEEPGFGLLDLADLGVEARGFGDGAEHAEDGVEISVAEVLGRFRTAERTRVEGMAIGGGIGLPDGGPLAPVECSLSFGHHGIADCRFPIAALDM